MLSSIRRWLGRHPVSVPHLAGRGPRRRFTLGLESMEDRTVPSTVQGTVFNDTNSNGELDEGENAYSNAYSTWSPRLLKAAYNFNFLRKNPGAAVHNGKYVIQIIIDSIEDLGGDISKYVRP